jgi:quercetin dioxygenase-like cupin family protein
MKIMDEFENIPYQTIDWDTVPEERHDGEQGFATWKTLQFKGLRIRIVKYSEGYLANHWCHKGHILHCLKGEMVSKLEGGEKFTLKPDMTYVVSDDLSSHRSYTKEGVEVLIIDGDFLKSK